MLGPLLHLNGFRDSLQAWTEAALTALLAPGSGSVVPGLDEALCGQFLGGLMGTADVYTGSGFDMTAMSSLRRSFVGFAHSCRAGGAGGGEAFVDAAIGGMT